jgi:hypothetical protein
MLVIVVAARFMAVIAVCLAIVSMLARRIVIVAMRIVGVAVGSRVGSLIHNRLLV